MTKRMLEEIERNIRVEYISSGIVGSFRCGTVVKRVGNTITVKDALNRRRRVHIERVRGYWRPRVKASPKNMINTR